MTARLTVAHGNVYARNPTPRRAKRVLRDLEPASFGVNEGTRFGRVRGYRRVVSPSAIHGARETPLYVRQSLEPLAAIALEASSAVPGDKLAHARWLTVQGYQHPVGRIAHLNVHLNAGIRQLSEGRHPRAKAYRDSVEVLETTIALLELAGFLPVVSGDVNVLERDALAWNPRHVFRRAGMHYLWRGLDVIAWDRQLDAVRDHVIPAGERTGADHPFLAVTLERAR